MIRFIKLTEWDAYRGDRARVHGRSVSVNIDKIAWFRTQTGQSHTGYGSDLTEETYTVIDFAGPEDSDLCVCETPDQIHTLISELRS